MISALILDDEWTNVENLAYILERDCAGVEIRFKSSSTKAAYEWLQEHSVDVIFLDIEMPEQNGFDFLKSLANYNFQVVLVTAYSHYSIKAIKAGALDYILKPVSIEEVQLAIERIRGIKASHQRMELHQELLYDFFKQNQMHSAPRRIALPQLGMVSYVDVDDIVSLEAQSNYTLIHKIGSQKQLVSRTLKEFESILDDKLFIRIHKSYIINMNYVKEYNSTDGNMVTMNDGHQWAVSRRQVERFNERMQIHSITFRKHKLG